MTISPARYALIFKAFFIDDFVGRRLAGVVAASPSADVYLMMDETAGPAGAIDFPDVIRYREDDVLELGFAKCAEGSLFWYNADYPLYYFHHLRPDYDYVVMIEYDAVPQMNIDMIVEACRRESIDFVGQPIGKSLDEYWWTDTLSQFYDRAAMTPYLICAAVFSVAAVRHLAAIRLAHGAAYSRPDASNWPIGEAFVGAELTLSRHRIRDWSSFGKLTRYDWWPPVHELELAALADEIVIHPSGIPSFRETPIKTMTYEKAVVDINH
jgi:hypothetical protein